MRQVESKVVAVPWVRRLVIDAGRAARRRHSVHGMFEVDVTSARTKLHKHLEETGEHLSLTAFVVACVARAVAADPSVQAYRDLRGREVIFGQVDIGLPIEADLNGSQFAFTHVLRDAGSRTIADLQREIHDVKADPQLSPSVRMAPWARAYLLMPGFARVSLLGALHRLPHRQRALAGTVGVTAVGMFGAGGGWGIAFQLHTLSIVIGGITRRPILFQGRLVERDFLQLTVSVDHDIVDGAPTARFVSRLRELLTGGNGIPSAHPARTLA